MPCCIVGNGGFHLSLSDSSNEVMLGVCLLRMRVGEVEAKDNGEIALEFTDTGDSGGDPSQCWLSERCRSRCLRGIGDTISDRSVSELMSVS